MEKQVKLINLKKATTSDSIPPKILKIVSHVLADALHSLFKDMLKTENFPENLKLADITPVFKKKNPLHKVNYRQLVFYLAFQKSLKKLMQKQISGYITNYLSPYLCGYRKHFSSQKALLSPIWESKKQKLLGVEIDKTLIFDEYIASSCKKAGKKLSVLARLSNFMYTKKKRILMKAFIESQFDYCLLIWMFHSTGVNNKN